MDKLRYNKHIFKISQHRDTVSHFECIKCKYIFYAFNGIKDFQKLQGKKKTAHHRCVIDGKVVFFNNVTKEPARIKYCRMTLKDLTVKDIIT